MATQFETRLERNLALVRNRMEAALERSRRQGEVTLVAVTKYVDEDVIRALHGLGVRDFGESRPQSIWKKAPLLPGDARWHLIGHWQSNKIQRTAPLITLAHSIDRESLALAVSRHGVEHGSAVPALLEVKLTADEAKTGFAPGELFERFESLAALDGLEIKGLMTMASLHDDPEASRPVFQQLRELRESLRGRYSAASKLEFLSMGMSQDFEVAVEEGATHVRVGSALFEGLP